LAFELELPDQVAASGKKFYEDIVIQWHS
jgi:hypothetical protein